MGQAKYILLECLADVLLENVKWLLKFSLFMPTMLLSY